MDYGFASHVLLWLIGAMAAVGGVITVPRCGRWGARRTASTERGRRRPRGNRFVLTRGSPRELLAARA